MMASTPATIPTTKSHFEGVNVAKAFFVRTLHGLLPDNEQAVEALRGVKIGHHVAVEVSRPRNLNHHRLYWALCNKIANALDVEAENISDVLKLRTGHFTTVTTRSGPVHLPRSISFASMDQTAFKSFFDRCCRVISTEWLPHVRAEQLQTEVLEMMGITWEQAA
jgi:hypothetical protein